MGAIGIREFSAAACAGLALMAAGAATAGDGSVKPNYTFADGRQGFLLQSHGGAINPDVIVSFNPPGGGDDGSLIALLDPADAQLFNPSTGGSFNFLIGLLLPAVIPGDGSVTKPDAPGRDGKTGLTERFGDHSVTFAMLFGPGEVNPDSWGGFDAGHNPPGFYVGGSFQFMGDLDPYMDLAISVDGTPLTFTIDEGAPEPDAWALMLLGFGGLGAALRTRRRAAQPVAG